MPYLIMSTYSEKLKDPRWKEKRQEILFRDNMMCRICEGSDELQVHHTIYFTGKHPWEYDNKYLITLCGNCHDEVEVKKEQIRWALTYLQQSRPWALDGILIAIKREIEGDIILDELRVKLEEINRLYHV